MIESVMAPPSARALLLIAALVCTAVSCAPSPLGTHPDAPRAVRGVLDLSGWDLRRDGPVRLAGEWDFYPGRLLGGAETTTRTAVRIVPDFWHGAEAGGTAGMGAGTYHLRVLLGERNAELGIRVPTVSTAFELDANGVTIAKAGRPAVLARDAIPGCFVGVSRVPTSIAPQSMSSSRILDLVVRVSNHEYRGGGMWHAFVLGPEETLLADKRLEDGVMLAFFGAAFATALVFLVIFLYRRRDPNNLYFASFVAVIALHSLLTGDYLLAAAFPSLPFEALIRLEYLPAFAPIPLCILFFGSLFPEEIPPRIRTLACVPFCVLALSLATPLPVLTRSIYVIYPLVVIVMIPIIIFGLGRAALRRRSGSAQMLAASVFLTVAGVAHMLNTSMILKTANLFFPSLAVFIFVQASILAKRSAAAFNSVERLSGELARTNDGLDRQVRERTRELENAYTRIKELSVKDPLTGAFNRRYVDLELIREVERAHRYGLPLSLLFCDFDHFKEINDRNGHAAGDDVLRAFSRIVVETIRDKVDWFARFGGEEFLIVAPGTRSEDAANLAERLRSRAEAQAAESEAGPILYTLSIGVSGLEAHDSSFGDEHAHAEAIAARLLAAADRAMYAAKSRGRNRVEIARQ
jgi:diguanylate cyclase (GGDEF)-like protein